MSVALLLCLCCFGELFSSWKVEDYVGWMQRSFFLFLFPFFFSLDTSLSRVLWIYIFLLLHGVYHQEYPGLFSV